MCCLVLFSNNTQITKFKKFIKLRFKENKILHLKMSKKWPNLVLKYTIVHQNVN